jgi:hypothetical protein
MSTRREDRPWERAWTVEIERRVEDVADGRVELVDAHEVHAELRTEIERRAREALAHPDDDVAWESVRAELHANPTRS